MALRTISATGGNWGTASTWEEGSVPTTTDDVVARSDGTSGNITVNVTAVCRSLNLTNYTATLTHNASVNLGIGGSTAPPGGIALLFSSAMVYNRLSSSCPIQFVSTANGGTITTNGKPLGTVTFSGVGGSWQLLDNISLANTTSGSFILVAGALDINGKTVTIGQFTCNGSSTRSLTFGAGTIVTQGWDAGGSNFSITPNTGTINVLGNSQVFNGAGTTYPTVSFSGVGDIQISDANTFTSLKRIGNANKTDTFILKANQTVTGLLQLQGNSLTNRVLVQSDKLGTPRTIYAGSVSLTNVDFQDIAAKGNAALSNPVSAFDADSIIGLSDAAALSSWPALGSAIARAYYPQQGGEDSPRYYVSAGPGGYPSVEFDGNAAFGVDSDILPTGNTPYTVVARIKLRVNNERHGIISQGVYGTNYEYNAIRTSWPTGGEIANALFNYWYGRDLFSAINALPSVGTAFTLAVTYDPAVGRKIYIDGSLVGSDSVSSRDGRGRATDGVTARAMLGRSAGSEYLNGYIRRLATYSSALDSTTRTAVETWAAAAPGSATWTGTSLGDCGGNSGITFTTAVTRYWVANTSNWSLTSSWAASSGGASGASVPLPQDNVVFDSGGVTAINNTIAIDMPRLGKNIDWSGIVVGGHSIVLNHLTNGVVYGSWTGKAGLSWGSVSTLTFAGRSSHTITVTSSNMNPLVVFAAFGGTYTLQDDMTCGTWSLTNGTFNANNHNVTSQRFSLATSVGVLRTLHMGSGNWTATGTGTIWDSPTSSGMTLDAGTSTLRSTDVSGTGKTINLNDGGDTTLGLYNFEQINASTGQLTLQGGFYHSVTISGGTRTVLIGSSVLGVRISGIFTVLSAVGAVISLSLNSTITLQTGAVWNVNGVSGGLGIIKSSNAGLQQQIVFASGITPASDYLNISDNYAVSPDIDGFGMPSVRAVTTRTASVRPYNADIPASAVTGDILVVLIQAGQISMNNTAGWAKVVDSAVPSGIGQSRYAIFTKICTGSDPGTTVAFNPSVGVDSNNVVYCFAIKNVGGAPVFAHNIQSGSTGADSWSGPTQTTAIKSFVLDFLYAQTPGSEATQIGYPPAMTLELSNIANSNTYHTVALSRSQSSAGFVSALAYTRAPLFGDWWAASQVSVRPKAPIYAGGHSTDSGNNLGWQFAVAPPAPPPFRFMIAP